MVECIALPFLSSEGLELRRKGRGGSGAALTRTIQILQRADTRLKSGNI